MTFNDEYHHCVHPAVCRLSIAQAVIDDPFGSVFKEEVALTF